MQFLFILWLVFALAVSLFAALNAKAVSVNLIFGTYQASLALVIIGSAFIGALAGYTIDIVPRFRNKFRIRDLEKKLKQTESELEMCRGTLAQPVKTVEHGLENPPHQESP